MKLGEVIKARTVIGTLYKEKISVKLAYKFMKFINATQKDEDFLNEKMQEIIKEYGERDDKNKFVEAAGGGIRIAPDKQKECMEKTVELDETEVDDPGMTFTLDELDELKLSIVDMNALYPFIKEE